MNDERSHQDDSSLWRMNFCGFPRCDYFRDLRVWELSEEMTSGDYAQRAVLGAAEIEMDAHGQHLSQDFSRRFDM